MNIRQALNNAILAHGPNPISEIIFTCQMNDSLTTSEKDALRGTPATTFPERKKKRFLNVALRLCQSEINTPLTISFVWGDELLVDIN